ncbi:MAG TPA: hypothetical protein VEF04_09030, partial [Blastocatellia bacterium]|nr:hypothetical protein [Blastocatellia bacterium]
MATQDLLINYKSDEEEAEDDDVRALLAALQSRRERQAKQKKAIRDKVTKVQAQIKHDAEVPDAQLVAIATRAHRLSEDVQAQE